MKKSKIYFIVLSLIVIISLISSTPAYTMKKESATIAGDIIGENIKSVKAASEEKEISREEFIKNLARQEGISFSEADKLDKIQTQQDYQKERNQSGSALDRKETVYQEIRKVFDTGSSEDFWSQVIVVLQVKSEKYYNPESGTYQKFSKVLDMDAAASGSGYFRGEAIALSTDITEESPYENKIVVMLSEKITGKITGNLSEGAENAGFAFAKNDGSKYIYTKLASIKYYFDSNYDNRLKYDGGAENEESPNS